MAGRIRRGAILTATTRAMTEIECQRRTPGHWTRAEARRIVVICNLVLRHRQIPADEIDAMVDLTAEECDSLGKHLPGATCEMSPSADG